MRAFNFCFVLILLTSASFAADDEASLKVEGEKGLKFKGYCVSPDGSTRKEIEGVTPTEIQL
jgi:hypothetical protein